MDERVVAGFVATGMLLGGCSASPSPSSLVRPSGCDGAVAGASAACATPITTGPPGGLSRDAAIAAALRLAPSSANEPSVIRASVADDPFTWPEPTNPRVVWEVRLQGSFAASPCTTGFLDKLPTLADPACLDSESGLVVVLDYFSGAFIGWIY